MSRHEQAVTSGQAKSANCRRRIAVALMLAYGPLKTIEIRACANVSLGFLMHTLGSLIDDGKVQRQGERGAYRYAWVAPLAVTGTTDSGLSS